MRTVDKGGVHIEQCLGCSGVFLDRGEMEAIARAEAAFYGGTAAVRPPHRRRTTPDNRRVAMPTRLGPTGAATGTRQGRTRAATATRLALTATATTVTGGRSCGCRCSR